MAKYHYEWWDVEAKEPTGTYTLEVKARNKDNAIKQFKTMTDGEINWETLRIDRIGHQR